MSVRHRFVRVAPTLLRPAAVAILGASLLVAGLCLTMSLGGGAAAADDAPGGARWILDLKHGPLRTVSVRDGSGGSVAYHYQVLEIANNTGHGRQWVPLYKAATDTKKSYIAGGCPDALEAVRRAERDPEIVSLESTGGMLANGRTIRAAAIFGPVDPGYDRITLQLHGLVDPIAIFKIEKYGSTEIVADSVYFERNQKILEQLRAQTEDGQLPQPTIEYREVRENRYWEMIYERLGDEFHAEDDHITFVSEAWRADGELKVLRVFGAK